MPLTLDQLVLGLVAALAFGFTGWFFLGAQMNVKRIHECLRWLRDGLPLVGAKTTMRWMGTTGVTLGIDAAHEPFKGVDVLILMEPRDVVPLWLLSHLQGRRDILIFRGTLRRHARVEFDVLDKSSWSGKKALAQGTPREWSQTTLAGGLLLASEGPDATAAAHELMARLGPLAPQVRCLSVRRTVPHVEVHLIAPWRSGVSSADLLKRINDSASLLLPR